MLFLFPFEYYLFSLAFGALLTLFHFRIGPLEVTPYSSTGYFCALVGIVCLLLVIFLFHESPIDTGTNDNMLVVRIISWDDDSKSYPNYYYYITNPNRLKQFPFSSYPPSFIRTE